MELTISKRSFLRGLSRTHAVADRKSSMAILSNILLSAEGQRSLRLAATDLYLGVDAIAESDVKHGGTVAVSARTLFDIVKNLPEGDVNWKLSDGHAEIRCGKVKYRIPSMPGDEFPPLPNPGNATFAELDAELIGELISHTQYSMSTDDTRPHLSGALFEGDGKIVRMVTTDGHRLSKAESRLPDGAPMLNFTMLVPNKGIAELKRLIEDARADRSKGDDAPVMLGIATAGGNAFFRREGVQLSVKLADEQFPPYAKVIPQKQERRIVVSRVGFIEALRRIALVASDKSGSVRIAAEPGLLRITSENPDVGEGTEEVDADYGGSPVTIGFNARYVLDVLGSLVSDEVALEVNGELDPGVLKPVGAEKVDFVGVIMPMRV